MRVIAEGAEARVFAADILGIHAVAKRRERKSYRINQIDTGLRSQRTRVEARILGIAAAVGVDSPRPLLVHDCEIVMSDVGGTTLRHALADNELGEHAAARMMRAAGSNLGRLHRANIAHGDYTPANIVVAPRARLAVIDFGLSEVTQSIEAKAIDLLLMKRSVDSRLFSDFLYGYRSSFRGADKVIRRLLAIERRGRYKTRTLLVTDDAP